MHFDENASPAVNARMTLPALVAKYAGAGRKLLAGNPEPAQLHALRLRTKRLRYTLELFAPCYGPGLDERLAMLRGVQQQLGEMNDCATVRAWLARRLPRSSLHRVKVERFLDQRLARAAAGLRRHWKVAFDAPGQDAWWAGYLSRPRAPRAKGSVK
jgi:CHAD domain-containing protein